MRRLLLIGLLISIFHAIDAQAANWYVMPNGGSYGSQNGKDWNNAYNGFTGISWASVSCGDTVWVAGGTYTQTLSLQKKCTAGSQLYIRRARSDASACSGAAGWNPVFASTVHQINVRGIYVAGDYDYITVSGRTIAGGGSYGWYIDRTASTGGAGIEIADGADADYLTFEYIDLQGPGWINYATAGRGLDITPFYAGSVISEGNTFSHMKIWDWESGAFNAYTNGSTFEYIEMYDIGPQNWSTWHPNGIYITSTANNGIVRYCNFHTGPNGLGVGEGVFFAGTGKFDNWKIYGNVFYNLPAVGQKAIHVREGVTITNLIIYNNTFDDVLQPLYKMGTCSTGCESKNNMIYNSGGGVSCGSTSNNLSQSSPNPFVNISSHDYHIVSTIGDGYPRNAGTSLTSYFTKDRDGTTFGGDGSWDIGAYEFGSVVAIVRPSAPINLTIN